MIRCRLSEPNHDPYGLLLLIGLGISHGKQ